MHIKGVIGASSGVGDTSTYLAEYGYKQPPLDTNVVQAGKLHKGAKNDHSISSSSEEDLNVAIGVLVHAKNIDGRGVHKEKVPDGVTGKILVASNGNRTCRELEDVSNVGANVGLKLIARKWWLMCN